MEPVFFDLETKYLFSELGMSQRQRDPSRLKVAVAGILSEDKPEFYVEDEMRSLFSVLDDAEFIVGFNVLGFDYAVLQPYARFDVRARYAEKTLDMFDRLRDMTSCWLGLDHLCEMNIGLRKNADTCEIPAMWREGRHDEVMSYLKNDLEMTRGLYEHVRKEGRLRYDHRGSGVKEIRFRW